MSDLRPPIRIAVAGAGICGDEMARVAEEVGREIARRGGILICGGLGGVMEAAARGATSIGGITVGLLPGGDARNANPYIRIPLATGLGEARNALVARTADAMIAIGGAWGTLSEVAFATKVNVPVVLLRPGLTAGLELLLAESAEEAVDLAFQAASP